MQLLSHSEPIAVFVRYSCNAGLLTEPGHKVQGGTNFFEAAEGEFLYRVMILREGRCFPPRPRETNSGRNPLSSTEVTRTRGPDSTLAGCHETLDR